MNYNYLIVIIFIIFFNLKLEIKKIIFLLLILCYFLYKKKVEYDENKSKIKSYPELENLDNLNLLVALSHNASYNAPLNCTSSLNVETPATVKPVLNPT